MKSLKTVRNHLDNRSIRYAQDKHAPRVTFSMDLGDCFVLCAVECLTHGTRVTTRGYVKCPAEKVGAMALFVAQANCGLSVGRFDLNVVDGEVMYVAFVPCEPAELSDGMLESTIGASLGTYGRYAKGLGTLVWTDADPAELIRQIECPDAELPDDPDWQATMERLMSEPEASQEPAQDASEGGEGPSLF